VIQKEGLLAGTPNEKEQPQYWNYGMLIQIKTSKVTYIERENVGEQKYIPSLTLRDIGVAPKPVYKNPRKAFSTAIIGVVEPNSKSAWHTSGNPT
jgi:hypothetical protein